MTVDKIRILRQRNNWPQTDLANELGITRSSVNAWELGISVSATKTVVELAGTFHVSTDYILGTSTDSDTINLEGYMDREKTIIYDLLNYFLEEHGRQIKRN